MSTSHHVAAWSLGLAVGFAASSTSFAQVSVAAVVDRVDIVGKRGNPSLAPDGTIFYSIADPTLVSTEFYEQGLILNANGHPRLQTTATGFGTVANHARTEMSVPLGLGLGAGPGQFQTAGSASLYERVGTQWFTRADLRQTADSGGSSIYNPNANGVNSFGASLELFEIGGRQYAAVGEPSAFSPVNVGGTCTGSLCTTFQGQTVWRDGAVWIFDVTNPSSPTVVQRLVPPLLSPGPGLFSVDAGFGSAVQFYQAGGASYLLVGAPRAFGPNTFLGRVHVYALADAAGSLTVTEIPPLLPQAGTLWVNFGQSLSVAGTWLAVDYELTTGAGFGRPALYSLSGGLWATIPPPAVPTTYEIAGPKPGNGTNPSFVGFDAAGSVVTGDWNGLGAWINVQGPAAAPPGTFLSLVEADGPYALFERLVPGSTPDIKYEVLELSSMRFAEAYLGGDVFCPCVFNSTNACGSLTAVGSPVLGAGGGQMTLELSNLPAQVTGYSLTATNPMATSFANPGGLGTICVAGAGFGRLLGPGQIVTTDAMGTASIPVDLNNLPSPTGMTAAMIGESRAFQVWHRDTTPVGGSTSNLTNAIRFTIQ
ncbi:MAG: hypothetical protein AAF726_03200 [Planctomycetota bacterium]